MRMIKPDLSSILTTGMFNLIVKDPKCSPAWAGTWDRDPQLCRCVSSNLLRRAIQRPYDVSAHFPRLLKCAVRVNYFLVACTWQIHGIDTRSALPRVRSGHQKCIERKACKDRLRTDARRAGTMPFRRLAPLPLRLFALEGQAFWVTHSDRRTSTYASIIPCTSG